MHALRLAAPAEAPARKNAADDREELVFRAEALVDQVRVLQGQALQLAREMSDLVPRIDEHVAAGDYQDTFLEDRGAVLEEMAGALDQFATET